MALATDTQPTSAAEPDEPLLVVDDLRTVFDLRQGEVRAVDGVSFALKPHETLAIVGESGCGKSITALSLMRLVPDPPGRIASGRVVLEGRDLLALDEETMRDVRGKDVAMIFQEPMTSLNPVLTIGSQIAEVVLLHEKVSGKEAWAKAVDMLRLTRIPAPEQRAHEYPHQLSGGMRQRAMISMALACNPKVLIADEPTTALDVTIQAQILELLADLQRRFGTSIAMITHDLGVIAEVASRVVVMYGGEVVEEARVETLFTAAHHPYTEGLLHAMPRVGRRQERLAVIPGNVPPPTAWPSGCRFRDRCPYTWDRCEREHPPLYQIGERHVSRCHLADEPERRETTRVAASASGIGGTRSTGGA